MNPLPNIREEKAGAQAANIDEKPPMGPIHIGNNASDIGATSVIGASTDQLIEGEPNLRANVNVRLSLMCHFSSPPNFPFVGIFAA
jgi:hypothetical protein